MQDKRPDMDGIFGLTDFIRVLANRKKLILCVILITTFIAGAHLWRVNRLDPVYRSYAVLAANGAHAFDDFRIIDNSFKDLQIVSELIQKHHLMPLIYPDLWDKSKSQWLTVDPPGVDEACLSTIKMLHVGNREVNNLVLKLEIVSSNPELPQSYLTHFINLMSSKLRKKELQPLLSDRKILREMISGEKKGNRGMALKEIINVERKIAVLDAREYHGFDVIIRPTPPKRELNPLSLKARPAALILSVAVLSLMAAIYLAFFVEYWQNLKRRRPDKYLALREAMRWNRDRT